MRIWNFIVLMTESIILSDEPIEHRLLMANRGIEWQDVMVTGHISMYGVSFRSSEALSRREITEEQLLAIQSRVKQELHPMVAVIRDSPENKEYKAMAERLAFKTRASELEEFYSDNENYGDGYSQ